MIGQFYCHELLLHIHAPAGGGCRQSRLGVISDGILPGPPSGATRHLPPAGG
ncbi:hypothetical protein BIFBRE_03374 [Bifidobacterium breve DSM 20213 = JCM 1192]|uniref:Uncharacterized protein n=1 Tax=Bifidobacterium breve DSM 20213 = JCM 1192 TaxID=518634 RepID=D4BMS6_BIFBR|nr:hypothetical protein BIFBRE_03374 [Bifidobacterium breve DSM 20213 = JCM 1192]